ncbi:hypothetical protein BDFG_03159 [Blastomyces dermatitidis ATCC 26199]|nr:hypothetical protein BDFG_03159 [Blastomyces dermatitidis ATCC 26199]
MESYITVLAERESDVITVMREAENRLNTDESTGRRNDISLQGTVTAAVTAKEAEEEGVTMKVVLPRLIDTAASAFNLTFLAVMEAAAALQRYLFTRKCQNKPSTVLQE